MLLCSDPDEGQRDGVCERHHVLQGEGRHPRRLQGGRLRRQLQAPLRHHAEECPRDKGAGFIGPKDSIPLFI